MMDHLKILSRAWTMLWHYRALWLFGFLFALAGGGSRFGGSPGGGSSSSGGSGSGGSGLGPGSGGPPRWPPEFSNVPWNTIGIIILGAVAAALLLIVILTIVRYIAETALIAGVDEIENTGEPLTVRRGFRLGWSRQAWRLFLTDLTIGLVLMFGILVLLALAASPLLLLLVNVDVVRVIAVGSTILLVLPTILFFIVVGIAFSLVMPYVQRRVVLGRQGILASIRQGLKLVRVSLRDTGLMWLLLIAIGFVWGIVKIPVLVMVVALSLVLGGVPAGLAYLISHSWVITAILGGSLFLLVLVPVMSFVEGLFQVYHSSVWTLAYRQVVTQHSDLLPVNGS
jgi:hypothetical protein